MIIVENINVYNLARAVYSSRNALNSWDKSDSDLEHDTLGENDLNLAVRLVKAGQEHRKFMRQIFVSMDITAPFYWWKQASTYSVGVTVNACSTMHKLTSKPIELSDFSYEDFYITLDDLAFTSFEKQLHSVVKICEALRKKYLETKDKKYWNGLIALLPEGYNQKRTVTMNYEVLYQMYRQRRNHKLKEWHDFCDVIATLPYAKELIVCENEEPFTLDEIDVGKDLKKAFDELGNGTTHITIRDGDKIISEWDVPTPQPTETIAATIPISEMPYIPSRQSAEEWSAKLRDLGIEVTDENGKFKSTLQILDEIGDKWNELYESEDKMVSHPDHYQSNGMEVIDVIESFTKGLEGIEATDTGNIIKYACRWSKKGNQVQDVEKIIWYATHLLNHLKGKNKK